MHGHDERDELDPKARMVERHLRGAQRFEERKENLARRKRRGHGPRDGRRSRHDLDDEYDEEDGLAPPPREPARRAATSGSRPASPACGRPARVSTVARTEVRVLREEGQEVTARLLPRVLATGGVVVGDEVLVDGDGRVVERLERRTLLERRSTGNAHRAQLIAANVDVGLVVLAPREDGLSLGFLDRAVAALEAGGIEPHVVVTKVDLLDGEAAREELEAMLTPWVAAGHPVSFVASPTGEGIGELRDALRGRVAVLIGHSGVGKSTLVNALDPTAGQLTGAVRERDGKGRQTTTASRLVPFLDGGALVDTSGVRLLVPEVRDPAALAAAVPELGPFLGRCRFADCAHDGEPGCAVTAAAEEDPAVMAALRRYRRLLDSASSQ